MPDPRLHVAPSWTSPRPEAYDRLLGRRVVFVRGALDDGASTDLCAELLALDGASGEPITLLVNSPGGPLPAIVPVLDASSLLRAPVHTAVLGQATGTAGILAACGTGVRRAGARSRPSLRVAEASAIDGTASEVGRAVELWLGRRDDVVALLASRTGAPEDELRRQLDDGHDLDPVAALALGLLDTLEPA